MSEEEESQELVEAAEEEKPVALTKDEKHFLVACSAGNKVQIELYAKDKGIDVNIKSDHYGLIPLNLVCGAGAVDAAKLLVELKADVTAADPMGLTPLHWVSKRQ